MKARGYVQITGRGGVLLRGIRKGQVVSGSGLEIDNHWVRAEIGIRGNDSAAQTAIVGRTSAGSCRSRIVRSIDCESCC